MSKHEKIIPIILAAGRSPALPFPKALAPFGRKTALQIAVENCSSLGPSLVVLGSDAKLIVSRVPPSTEVVINRRWREGQLSSLQAALNNIDRDTAFLIYPVDLPLLTKNTVQRVVRAFHARSASQQIVMPRYKGAYGHPVIISPAVRREFFEAPTARDAIYRAPERIRVVNVSTNAILEDFNTMESYDECLSRFSARNKRRK